MSQVRKFNTGGKAFKINGKTYNTGNVDDMKMLEDMAQSSSYGGVAQFVLDNVNHDSYNGDLDISRTADGNITVNGGLKEVQDKHMSKQVQKSAARPNRLFKGQAYKNFGDNLNAFTNAVASRSKNGASSKIKLTGVGDLGGKWAYNDDGWNEADLNNTLMLKRFNALRDYVTASEEDRKNKYDISGVNKDQLDALVEMYQTDPTIFDKYSSYFAKDAERLGEDSDFYSTFGWFGFTPGSAEEVAAAKQEAKLKKSRERLKSAGYNFEGMENLLDFDDQGNLIATDQLLKSFQGNNKGHYWLNDAWTKLTDGQGNLNPYSDLKGHIIWNGRVYREDDAAIQQILADSGYADANKAYDATKADQIMATSWGQGNTFAHQAYDPTKYYSEWADSIKGLRFRTVGGYNVGDNGEQLVEYYSDEDPTDAFGYRKHKLAIIGADGKLIKDNVNLSDYQKTGSYSAVDTTFMKELLGEDAGKLAGTYSVGFKNSDGTASNTFVYKGRNGEYFISDPGLYGEQNGKVVQIPKEIAEKIPENVWEYFRTHADAKNHLFLAMRDWTNSGWSEFWQDRPYDRLIGSFEDAGMSSNQAKTVVDLIFKYGDNDYLKKVTGKSSINKAARAELFLSDPVGIQNQVKLQRAGGILQKFGTGGPFGEQSQIKAKKIDIVQDSGESADIRQSREIGSGAPWTAHDKAELIALIGDAASIGLSFVPGAHLGAAAAGAAASTTNFITDIRRDGFQWKDLGGYAVNLGFDALSVFTGAGGKLAKFAKNFPKVAKLIRRGIKAGAIAGVSDAVALTVDKIANGEAFTMSDVRRVMNGVTGAATLGKTGLGNQTKGKLTNKVSMNIEGKGSVGKTLEVTGKKMKSVTLDDATMKRLKGIKDPEQVKLEIANLWKAQNPTSKMKVENVVKRLDFTGVIKPTKKGGWAFPRISGKGMPGITLDDAAIKKLRGISDPEKAKLEIANMWKAQNPKSKLSAEEVVKKLNFDDLTTTSNKWGWKFWEGPKEVTTLNLPKSKWHRPTLTTKELDALTAKRGGFHNWVRGTGVNHRAYNNMFNGVEPTAPRMTVQVPHIVSTPPPAQDSWYWSSEYDPNAAERKNPLLRKGGVVKYDKGGDTGGLTFVPSGETWDFDWNHVAKEGFGMLNALLARRDAKEFKRLSDKKADILSAGQPDIWHDKGRARFQTNTDNLTDKEIAQNNSAFAMNYTADPMINLTSKLEGAKYNAAVRNKGNRDLSKEFSTYLAADADNRATNDWQTFTTKNTANQYASTVGNVRNAGEIEYLTNLGAIRDKELNKWEQFLNRQGLTSVVAQNRIDQLKLMRAQPGLSEDQIAQIDAQINLINSEEYQRILRRQARYGTPSAKKGGKMRSTSDQMLLDNNKIVAKAIQNLNDSTMKLLLKALS